MGAETRKSVNQRSQELDLLPQSTISYLKYRFWLPKFLSMASSEPMPRYFFSLIPSEKKYSPGASVVAARREPIITSARDHQGQQVSSRKAAAAKILSDSTQLLNRAGPLCSQPPALVPSLTPYGASRGTPCTTQLLCALLTCGSTECEGLGDVSNCLNPSVCNHRDAKPPGIFGHLVHSRGLGAAACQHYRWGEGRKRVSSHTAPLPHPSRPCRLPAHTCPSTQEPTNPWGLLPWAEFQRSTRLGDTCWDILVALSSAGWG